MILKKAFLIKELTEGFEKELADVVVEDGMIKEILPAGSCSSCAEEYDLAGKTLLPGMFDLHMHLYFSTDDFAANALRGQNNYVFDSIDYAKEMLRQGYTTIRDCGNPHYIGLALRDAIAAGIVDGPRIISAGMCISPFAKGNDTFPNLYYEVNSPEGVRTACRDEYAKGVDFFKYMATGSVANLTGVPGELISSREEIFALQAAADAMGVSAAVHCHGKEGIHYCAEAGIKTIEHASMIDEEEVELILKMGNRSAIIPTLTPVIHLYLREDCDGLPPIILKKIDEVYAHAKSLVSASRSGVLTGWGTDISCDFFRTHIGYEFKARESVGYSNIEMLQQVTINSAKILGLDDCLGTVKVGKIADFVVVDGNPASDISVMRKYPAMVFKEGKRVTL